MTTPSSTPDWPVWLARSDVPVEDKAARLAEYVAAHGTLPKGCDFLWSETSKLAASGQSSAAVLPQLFPRLAPQQLASLLRGAPEANTRTLFAGLIAGSVQDASLKPVLSAFVRVVDEERLGSLVRSLGQLAGLYPADEPMMGQRLLAVLRKLPQNPARFSQHLAALRTGARWMPQGDDRVRAWRQFHESFERFVKACRQKASLLTASGLRSEREEAAQQLLDDLTQAMPAQWYADDPQASAKRQLLAGLVAAAKLPADGPPKDFEKKADNYFQTGKWALPPPPPKPQPAPARPAAAPAPQGVKRPAAAAPRPTRTPGAARASGAASDVSANAWRIPVAIGIAAIVMLIGVAVYQAFLLHGRQVASGTPSPTSPSPSGSPADSKDVAPPVVDVPKPAPTPSPTPALGSSTKPQPDPPKPAPEPAPTEPSDPPGGANANPPPPTKKTPAPSPKTDQPKPMPAPKILPGFPIAEEPKEEVAPDPSQTPSVRLCDLDPGQPIPRLYLHGAESIEVKRVSFASDDPKRESYALRIEGDKESEPEIAIAKFVLDTKAVHLQIQPSELGYVKAAQSRLRFCVLEVRDEQKKSSRFVALQKPRRESFPLEFDAYPLHSEADLKIQPGDAPPSDRFCLGAGRLIHNLEGPYDFGSEVATKEPTDRWRLSTLMDQHGLSRFQDAGLKGLWIGLKKDEAGALVLAVETEPVFVELQLQDVSKYMKATSILGKVRQLIADLQDPSFETRFNQQKTPEQRFEYVKGMYWPDMAGPIGTPSPPSNPKSKDYETWAWRYVLNLDKAKASEKFIIDCLAVTPRPQKMDMQDELEKVLKATDSLEADVYRIVEIPKSGGGDDISVRVLVIGRPK